MNETKHVPVLLEPILEKLRLAPGMIVVDATLGGGGYTQAVLDRVLPGGKVIALDWDEGAIQRFQDAASARPAISQALQAGNLVLLHQRFSELESTLKMLGIERVDAVIADLGLSSDQLEDPRRGISFQLDGPLDMRLNTKETITAGDMVNRWSEEKLRELLQTYGDEREAKRIVHAILKARSLKPIARTKELAEIVSQAVSPWRRRARIHPATQTFQALRMAVNSELAELERFLPQAVSVLAPQGILAIVTFHSGEDALVKHFIDHESRGCICGFVPCLCHRQATLIKITKKPIRPSVEEAEQNPRSRSAKLRIAQKK